MDFEPRLLFFTDFKSTMMLIHGALKARAHFESPRHKKVANFLKAER